MVQEDIKTMVIVEIAEATEALVTETEAINEEG